MGAASLPTLRSTKFVSAARVQRLKKNRRPAKNTAVNERENPIMVLFRGDSHLVEAQFYRLLDLCERRSVWTENDRKSELTYSVR